MEKEEIIGYSYLFALLAFICILGYFAPLGPCLRGWIQRAGGEAPFPGMNRLF